MDQHDRRTESVPAEALRCVVGPVVLGDNGDGAASAPFRMVARTGDALDHWWWGKVVHDLGGMRLHKPKLPIDYAHDDGEVIGYANHFDASSGDLEVTGALIPFGATDRAAEVIHKARAGVPYEASINFGGEGIEIDKYGEGAKIAVNGREFSGPITVIRSWPLRGIAVCPYGADMNTSTSLNSARNVEVTVMKKEATEQAAELVASVEAAPETDAAEISQEIVEAAAQPAATNEAAQHKAPGGLDYLERFGDRGGVWFAQGKSWAECLELERDQMAAEIEQLRAELSALKAEGERSPVNFQPETKPERGVGLANRIRIVGRQK